MQEKKIRTFIRFILALFIIGFAYSLSFTFIVNKKEKEIGNDKEALATLYESDDPLVVEPWTRFWLTDYTYKQAKKNALNLGLDLKGGMSAVLEVSQRDLIESLIQKERYKEDGNIVQVVLDSLQKDGQSGADAYIDNFYEAIKEKENKLNDEQKQKFKLGKRSLLVDMFSGRTIKKDFKNDDAVKEWLKEESENAYQLTFESLKRRLDQFGLANPSIQKIESTKQILIELPGMTDQSMVDDYLSATGSLAFWKGVTINELYSKKPELFKDEEFLAIANLPCIEGDTITPCTPGINAPNLLSLRGPAIANIPNNEKDKDAAKLYFDSISKTEFDGKVIFYLTESPQERKNSEDEKEKREIDSEFVQVIALDYNYGKTQKPGMLLDGDAIESARQDFNTRNEAIVIMTMTGEGASKWSNITASLAPKGQNKPVGDHVAIVMDEEVYSYPVVNQQLSVNSEITGNFDPVEAQMLASILNSGKLAAKVEIQGSEYVGPSLGKESVKKGYNSFLIALLFVLLYMIFYYAHAGVASNLALIINMFFIFGALSAFNATLTLPGIAGIVLTIGMAVDANVLIYERIKEELSQDKGLSLAVRDGYKHAYSAIIDANITTLLTAMILFYFGTGPIKGFATTLMIGIMTSLFCAIFITRLVFESRLAKKKRILFSNRLTKNLFRNTNISFIKRRKWAYVFSTLLICIGIVSLFTNKLDLGVDLKGGRSYVVQINDSTIEKEINTTDLRNELGGFFEENGVKKYPEIKETGDFGIRNELKITTSYKLDADEEGVQEDLIDGIMSYLGISSEDYEEGDCNADDEVLLCVNNKDDQSKNYFKILQMTKVGPTIADDLRNSAFLSIIFALSVIFIYIFIRFRKWQYSLGAVVALFHDVLIILSVFSLLYGFLPFSLEVNQAFIAAILTVIGYSLNDTVVVFDRVREFQKIKVGETKDIVNRALNSTLSRTINTSLTTIVVLLIIFIFGGDVIRGFMFALILGVVVGTYSSLFIATPIMVDTTKKKKVT